MKQNAATYRVPCDDCARSNGPHFTGCTHAPEPTMRPKERLAYIARTIRKTRNRTARDQYTDTGDLWELLNRIEEMATL